MTISLIKNKTIKKSQNLFPRNSRQLRIKWTQQKLEWTQIEGKLEFTH